MFEEPDERFNVGVGRTRDRKYLLLECGSHITSECHYLEAKAPTAAFRLIAPRITDQEYDVDHRAGLFYIRVNDTGKNFRVVTAPVNDPSRESWTEILPEQPNIPLHSFDLFQTFAVASETVEGLDRLRVFHFKNDVLQTGNTQRPTPPSISALSPSPSPTTAPAALPIVSSIHPPSAIATLRSSRPYPFTSTM